MGLLEQGGRGSMVYNTRKSAIICIVHQSMLAAVAATALSDTQTPGAGRRIKGCKDMDITPIANGKPL
jgi:hypothetical protein